MSSKVREVHMIGRRGAAQAKFTTKELRELGELNGVDVVVYGGETDLDAFDPTGESARLAAEDRHVRGNYTVIKDLPTGGLPATGVGCSSGSGCGRPSCTGRARCPGSPLSAPGSTRTASSSGPASYETLDAQLVLRSVGYQSVPLLGVPFDDRSSTVPNTGGRVTGRTAPRCPASTSPGGSSAARAA